MKSRVRLEIWKPIKGYESLYEVSNLGRVYSLYSKKILKPLKRGSYLCVDFWKNGKEKRLSIHRLVCRAFNGEPISKLYEVNHKDGIKKNNFDKNLEWVTKSENTKHAYDVLNSNCPCGDNHWSRKLKGINPNRKKVILINPNGERFIEYGLRNCAKKMNVSRNTIINALKGRHKLRNNWYCELAAN